MSTLRLAPALALLSVLAACASEADPPAKQPAADSSEEAEKAEKAEPKVEDKAEPEPENTQLASPMTPVESEQITITAKQAADRGLPALGFSLNTARSGMSGSMLAESFYLQLSGPPGGPLSMQVFPAKVGDDPAALVSARALEAKVASEQVELLGGKRPAAAWISGESLARTSWCALIVAPEGAAEGDPALMLELGVGNQRGEAACKNSLEHHVLKPVLDTFKFE